jgi:hypothetical protein
LLECSLRNCLSVGVVRCLRRRHRVLRLGRIRPMGRGRRVHGTMVRTLIGHLLNRTCTIVGLRLIFRDVWGVTRIWAGRLCPRWLGVSIGGTRFGVHVSFFIQQDGFHAIPIRHGWMRARKGRPWIFWTNFGRVSGLI